MSTANVDMPLKKIPGGKSELSLVQDSKPRLLYQLRESLRARHYSRRTEQIYCSWVKRYIFFHNDRMVKAIHDKSGHDAEFVKLTDLNFSGYKGCVQLCARPQVCKLADDAQPYYEKVKEADAVVIGTPVYMRTITSTAWAFIERFFGYRHVDIPIAGKPFVTVVGGAFPADSAVKELHRLLGVYEVNVIDTIKYQSSVPTCFKCGRHKEC